MFLFSLTLYKEEFNEFIQFGFHSNVLKHTSKYLIERSLDFITFHQIFTHNSIIIAWLFINRISIQRISFKVYSRKRNDSKEF
jgi:hypothetical protein